MTSYPMRVDEYQVENDGTGSLPVRTGGVATKAIAAGVTGNTVIKGGPGVLCRVLVTTAGTAAMSFEDGSTVIGVIPANTAAGTIVDIQMPAAGSIVAIGNAANPAVTVAFI
ncbi:MAG: hypothetical protein ACRDFS_11705 [Chloroflexota bacterium]